MLKALHPYLDLKDRNWGNTGIKHRYISARSFELHEWLDRNQCADHAPAFALNGDRVYLFKHERTSYLRSEQYSILTAPP